MVSEVDVPIIGSTSATAQQNGLDLQSALTNPSESRVIEWEAGAQFLGPFFFPKIAGASVSSPIVVRSTAIGSLPAAGQRVTRSTAGLMPTLLFPSQAGSSGIFPYNNPYA